MKFDSDWDNWNDDLDNGRGVDDWDQPTNPFPSATSEPTDSHLCEGAKTRQDWDVCMMQLDKLKLADKVEKLLLIFF